MNKLNTVDIIELSKTKSQKEISKIFNVSVSTIGRLLRGNNVNTSRSRLNESRLYFNINYFDEIDTHEKAYWLGFISADGCLKSNKVRLVSKDKEVIIKFKKAIESEHKIVESITTDKRSGKINKIFIISITNNLFTKKLSRLISVDKSNSFSLPEIDNNLYSSFIAGLFDGDGSFTICDNGKIKLSLISTKECLSEILDILEVNIGLKKRPKILNHYTTYRIHIYKYSEKFLDYIYNENYDWLFLSRKYIKYYEYKKSK